MNDMQHMEHLQSVADGDVVHLQMKEHTYRGSWKAAGGRSAWFMLRRKIDRLLVMMARPVDLSLDRPLDNVLSWAEEIENGSNDRCNGMVRKERADIIRWLRDCYLSENIFAKIREKPDGEDGSVLAEIRDLRRYLLLVEAEMTARGVVQQQQQTKIVVEERQTEEITSNSPWLLVHPTDWYTLPPTRAIREIYESYGLRTHRLPAYLTEPQAATLSLTMSDHTIGAEVRHFASRILAFYECLDGGGRVLRIAHAPVEWRTLWPVLRAEYNATEIKDLDTWSQALYEWIESETKWRVKPQYEAWTRG